MNKEQGYLIELLSSHINNTKPKKVENINMKLLCDIAKEQLVTGIIYKELLKSYTKDEIGETYAEFKRNFFSSVQLFVEQEEALKGISDNLSKNKIQHIFLKGLQIKKLYPASELRTMADIDIFVRNDSFSNACDLFEELGYNMVSSNPNKYAVYMKNKIIIELHKSVSEVHDVEKSSTAFSLWEMIVPVDEDFNLIEPYEENKTHFTNFLTPDALFLLVLAHIVKHMKSKAAGIRMFLDLAVISQKYYSSLNWEQIYISITKMGYNKASEHIFYIINKWFDVDIPICKLKKIKDNLVPILEEFILDHGTFGILEKDEYAIRMKHGILKNIFKSRELLTEKYPTLEKYGFLLPLFWIYRFFLFLFGKTRTKFKVKEIMKSMEPAKEYRELLKNIGIWE